MAKGRGFLNLNRFKWGKTVRRDSRRPAFPRGRRRRKEGAKG